MTLKNGCNVTLPLDVGHLSALFRSFTVLVHEKLVKLTTWERKKRNLRYPVLDLQRNLETRNPGKLPGSTFLCGFPASRFIFSCRIARCVLLLAFGAERVRIARIILSGWRQGVVNFPEPAWPTPCSWLGGKIDIGIENERRLAAVDGNKHPDFYLERVGAILW